MPPLRSRRHPILLVALLLVALPAAAQPGAAPADPPPTTAPGTAAAAGDPTSPRPRGLVTREEVWEHVMRQWGIEDPDPAPRRPTSRADSLAWERWRRAAAQDTRRRVVVSLFDRRLWLVEGRADTLLSAPVAVGMGVVKVHGQTWDHSTPRGRRRVIGKEADPVWIPPDWHYIQQAAKDGRQAVQLRRGRGAALADGRRLVVRDSVVGVLDAEGAFEEVPPRRPIVFGDTLYIPPVGTLNRRIPHVLGRFKLDTGDGYLLHGTENSITIGFPSTHGCIRVPDAELEQLFAAVEVGTPVYIY